MSANRLIYLPLGGAGEIGMNAYVYGYGPKGAERLILVDLGVAFGVAVLICYSGFTAELETRHNHVGEYSGRFSMAGQSMGLTQRNPLRH